MHGNMHTGMHNGHEAELHFDNEIHDDDMERDWRPPQALDAPPPREGMVQRWIRLSLKGKTDAENMANQNAQGWRPRSLSTVPEGQRKLYPSTRDSRTGGEFMVKGDLVLCEMSIRMARQARDHYRGKARSQVGALSDNLNSRFAQEADPRGDKHGIGTPYVEHRSSHVTTRRPIVAADK